MFCEACGTEIQPRQRFCSSCGKLLSPEPIVVSPIANRVRQHVHLLGIFWLAVSALHLLAGVLILAAATAFLGTLLPQDAPLPAIDFFRPFMVIVAILILGKGILGVITGIGLLKMASWGRLLALAMAFISLLEFPFGTALAIYTLVVLLSPNAHREYHALHSH